MMNQYQNKPSLCFVIGTSFLFGGLIGFIYLFPLAFENGFDFGSAICSFIAFILCLALFGYFWAPLKKFQIIIASLLSGLTAGIVWWCLSTNAPESPVISIISFAIGGFLWVAAETQFKLE